MRFWLNHQFYTVEECEGGYAWTLWAKDGGIIAEAQDYFPTAVEAQQDAMRYESRERADESYAEWELEFYGHPSKPCSVNLSEPWRTI